MAKIGENFIYELKNLCDIVSIVASYVELKSAGRSRKCLCPFHSEKTASMVVYEDTQSFYCFGCGVGGDVITFIEKIENLNYVDSVKFLAHRVGLSIPDDDLDDEISKKRQRILAMNRLAARFFYNNLKSKAGRIGLEYFQNRGLFLETIIKFGLGYADDSWGSLKNYLNANGFFFEEMCDADLVIKSIKGRYYDKFRNRVMFPIIDAKGDVVGFGGRVLDESKPKYLNTSDTLAFKKSLGLYGLNFAKNAGVERFILCEGYMDVISMHQNGFRGCVATLGTALTQAQVRLISRHVDDVVMLFDSDEAGALATDRAYKMFLEVGISPRALRLKGAKDPDEYVKKYGASRLKLAIDQSRSAIEVKIENIASKYNLNDPEQKKRYINEYCYVVSDILDPLEREVYVGQLCQSLKVAREIIKNHVNYLLQKKRKSSKKRLDKEISRNIYTKRIDKNVCSKYEKAERGIIRFLYNNPDYLEYISNKIDISWFSSKSNEKIYNIICDRIKSNFALDFLLFHEILTDDEMGTFSKIVNEGKDFANTTQEIDDYMRLIREKYEKESENISAMTLEQIELRRKKYASGKR